MKNLINRAIFKLKKDGFIEVLILIFFFLIKRSKKINLDRIEISNNKTLDEIFLTFGTDKGKLDGKKTFYKISKNLKTKDLFKNYKEWILRKNLYDFEYETGLDYVSIYEKIFFPLKNKKLNILEIGVAGGHSHASWYKYFQNSNIYGIDIKKKNELLYTGKRLKYFEVDCTNQKQIKKFINTQIKFDIIIDDSLHEYSGYTSNLINFFPILNSNGYYFVEDFLHKDKALIESRNYNEKNGKKLTGNNMTMNEIFSSLIKKEFFENIYFSKKSQEYFHNNSSDIEIFYPGHPSASICLLRKK
jgi:hypothetical protein